MVKSNSPKARFQRGAKITLECSHCKKPVTRYASQVKATTVFCSRGCWYTYRLGKRKPRLPELPPTIADKEYAELYINQHGMCAICLRHSKRLAIDHNHKTGMIRGLLCNNCNVALGMLGDSMENLERALAYLHD